MAHTHKVGGGYPSATGLTGLTGLTPLSMRVQEGKTQDQQGIPLAHKGRPTGLRARVVLPSGAGLTLSLRGREARNFRTLCATHRVTEEEGLRKMIAAGWEMAKSLPWPTSNSPDGVELVPWEFLLEEGESSVEGAS